jgi:hypothetical protein
VGKIFKLTHSSPFNVYSWGFIFYRRETCSILVKPGLRSNITVFRPNCLWRKFISEAFRSDELWCLWTVIESTCQYHGTL